MNRNRWRLAHLAASAALVASLASGGPALAQTGEPAQADAPGIETHTAGSGGAISAVRIVSDAGTPVVMTATAFANFPATASTTVPVPPGQSRLIIATFTAESACSSPTLTTAGWCSMRILIDGVEGAPVAGTDFAFNTHELADEGPNSWESLSMTRWRRVTNTSTVTLNVVVQVQGANTASMLIHRLDDWTLLVQAAV
jgi:hypothetical protein